MDEISEEDKKLAEQMAIEYARRCKVHPTKGRYDFSNPAQRTFSGSGSVTFSDTGNKADFTETDFSRDEEVCFKELNPLEKIKRIVFNEEARAQATGWAKKRNKQIKAAKGRRFAFTYHPTKYN